MSQIEYDLGAVNAELPKYSTDETIVGTWIDGRNIYRKAFYDETNSISSNTEFNLPYCDTIVSSGILYRANFDSCLPMISAIKNKGTQTAYVTIQWYGGSFSGGTSWWCDYVKSI